MKTLLTTFLFCIAIAAKSQQLPKSGENSISDRLKLDSTTPAKPMPQFGENAIRLFDRNEMLNENLAKSSNIFRNKAFLGDLEKKKFISYTMPIVDTKNDNSRSKTFVPDLFKSNMPVVSTYSYW